MSCTSLFNLSSIQQDVYFDQLKHPQSSRYNIGGYIEILEQELSIENIQKAHRILVNRYDVFGLRMLETEQGVKQYVSNGRTTSLPLINLSDEADPEAAFQAMIKAWFTQTLPILDSELYKCCVVKLSGTSYRYVALAHHLIMDGFGFANLVNNLASLYRDEAPEGETLAWQEVVLNEQAYFQSKRFEKDAAFWKSYPLIDNEGLFIPYALSERGNAQDKSTRYTMALSQSQVDNIQKVSENCGIPVTSVYCTLMSVYLRLTYGRDALTLALPVHNRKNKAQRDMLGAFLSYSPVSLSIDEQDSFASIAQKIMKTQKQMLRHQQYPLSQIVADRDAAGLATPAFDLQFNYLKLDRALTFESGQSDIVYATNNDEKIPFGVTVWEHAQTGEVALLLDLQNQFFTEHDAALCQARIGQLINGLVGQEASRLTQLPFFAEQEADALVCKAQSGAAPRLNALFDEYLQADNLAPALADETTQFTYQSLYQQSRLLGQHLTEQGIKKGDIVGIGLERSAYMVSTLLACLQHGITFVPLDSSFPQARIAHIVEQTGMKFVLCDGLTSSRFAELPVTVVDVDSNANVAQHSLTRTELSEVSTTAASEETLISDDVDAYILFTSGSSGVPKGVPISRRALAHFLQGAVQKLSSCFHANTRTLAITTFTFDIALLEVFGTLVSGGEVYVASKDQAVDPLALQQLIEEKNINGMQATPTTWKMLLESSWQGKRDLRALVGGEALTADLASRLLPVCQQLWNCYGPTEATIWSMIKQVTANEGKAMTHIGGTLAHYHHFVLLPNGELAPQGIPGELCIAGPSLSRGYINLPEKTQAHFIDAQPSLAKYGIKHYYRTGDLVRCVSADTYQYLGRIDAQVKLNGYRIELGEIEQVLLNHHAVGQSTVVVNRSLNTDGVLAAFVVLANANAQSHAQAQKPTQTVTPIESATQTQATITELQHALAKALPAYMLPKHIVVLDALPQTANGKIDRKPLQTYALGLALSGQAQQEKTQEEAELARIWAQVLSVSEENIHPNSHFFALGGNSLSAVKLLTQLHQQGYKHATLQSLFSSENLAALASELTVLSTENSPSTAHSPSAEIAKVNLKPKEFIALSAAQKRLWLIDKLQGKSPEYNMFAAFDIAGEFNVQKAQSAFEHVVEQHPILRVAFKEQNGEPVQYLLEHSAWSLIQHDLTPLTPDVQSHDLHRLIVNEQGFAFDLSTGHNFRVTYIALAPEQGVLLLNVHHIVADGWSVNVLFDAFKTQYQALLNEKGQGEVLSGNTLQAGTLASTQGDNRQSAEFTYFSYLQWHNQQLQSDAYQRQADYWKTQLAGIPESHSLPLSQGRPAVKSNRGMAFTRPFSPALEQAVRQLAQRTQMTPFMVVHSALALVLSRHSTSQDIVIGTPFANRSRTEFEQTVGVFVNPLVLRANTQHDSVSEYLSHIKQVHLAAQQNQDMPFDKLVDELNIDRNMQHSPVFQIVLNADDGMNALQQAQQGLPFTLKAKTPAETNARFDLEINLQFDDNIAQLYWIYDNSIFTQEGTEQLHQHLENMLQALASATDTQSLGELHMLSPQDLHTQQFGFNDTRVALPGSRLMHQLFQEAAQRDPNAPAVISSHKTVSYQTLFEQAYALSLTLKSQGVGPEVLVAVLLPKVPEQIVAVMAINMAGGAYLPLSTDWPESRNAAVLEQAQCYLLIDEHGVHRVSVNEQRITHNYVGALIEQQKVDALDTVSLLNNSALFSQQNPADLAYVIFTSGSTGKPKGVAIEHQMAVNTLLDINSRYNITHEDRAFGISALSFDLSVYDIFGLLAVGGAVVLPDTGKTDLPQHWLEMVERHQVTVWNTVPTSAAFLCEQLEVHGRACQSNMKVIMMSGDWIATDLPARLFNAFPQAQCYSLGGATEGSIWSINYPITQDTSDWKSVPYGKPLANQTFYILDENLAFVPHGVTGELFIGGEGVAREYYNDLARTQERYIFHPYLQERLYRTGDLGRYLPDGNIEFAGRKDHQVKIRGFRIELGEIEFQLSQHDFVQSSVAVAREDVPGQKQLVAYVVAKPQSAESGEGVATSNSSSEASNEAGVNSVQASTTAQTQTNAISAQDSVSTPIHAESELTKTQAEKALPSAATQAEQIQQLKASLQENLPDYMVPAAIMVLDSLPLTANGKVDKKQLPMPDWAGLAEASYVAAESQTEAKLVELWAGLLNLTAERLSVEANFFELGGDSILSIQLVSKAAKKGLQFGVKDLFEARTIRRLAKHIDKQTGTESTILAPQDAITGQQTLLPIQNEFFEDEADLSHFNQSLLLTIPKDLDLPLLQAMVHKLYERHDALRLVFGKSDVAEKIGSDANNTGGNNFVNTGSEEHINSVELGQCWQGEYRDIEQLAVSELVTEIDWADVNSDFETTSSSSSLKSDKTSSNSGSINVDKTSSNQTQKTNAFGQWATSIQKSLDIENGALMRAVIVRNVDVDSADSQELSNLAIEKSAEENSSSNLNETQNSSTNSNSSTDRLFLVIHHLVVDGVSWRVLLQDLAALYEQHQQNQALELDAKTSSYQQWGAFLAEFAQSDDIQSQVEYWQQVVEAPVAKWSELEANRAGADTSLDVSLKQSLASEEVQFGELTFSLNESTTQQLLSESNQAYRTRINELLLSGLLLGMQQWQGLNAIRIDLESHGREALNDALDFSETLGWFTSIYPCLLSVDESGLGADLSAKSDVNSNAGAANIANLICSVKEQYRGIPTGGLGYGLLSRASVVDDELNTESQPQINPISASHSELLFNYLGQFDASTGEGQVFTRASESTGQGVSLKRAQMHGLSLNGYVEKGQLHIGLGFDKTRYSEAFLQDWMQAYESGLSAIVAHCQQVVEGELSSKFTPSDFPLATMNQASLDAWQNDFVEASVQNAIQDIYPATGMQQGMLFHSLLASDSYATQVKVGFSGLHGTHFKAAWEQVIARHDIFRTRFVGLEKGQAHQLVQRHAELEWNELDLTHLAHDKDAQNAEVEAYRLADKQRGFDVERAPLMRLALITLSKGVSSKGEFDAALTDVDSKDADLAEPGSNHESEDQQILIWTHHHALLDGWCISLVFSEVSECYRAKLADETPKLRRVQPYRNYVAWLAQHSQAESMAYWQETLADFEGKTALPLVSSSADTEAKADIARTRLDFDETQTQSLVRLARRHGTTVNVLLQAAWGLLLSRYSGESSVIFGVTTSGRPAVLEGANDMVGLFINTIPMKLAIDENQSLKQWLGKVHSDLVSADSHSYLPLADIQKQAPVSQSLFDSLIVFENYPVDAAIGDNARRAKLSVNSVDNYEGNNYAVSLVAYLGRQLEVNFEVKQSLLNDAQIAQIQRHLQHILLGMLAQPATIADIALLAEEEQNHLLTGLASPRETFAISHFIHEQFQEQARDYANDIAVVYENTQLTYAELDQYSTALAQQLKAQGIGSDSLIAVCLPRSAELIIAILAVLKTGNGYVPLDPTNPRERLAYILQDTQAPCVLVAENDTQLDASLFEQCQALPVSLAALQESEANAEHAQTLKLNTSTRSPSEHVAYVIYTSGSTGQPKGVVQTHENALRLFAATADEFSLSQNDTWAMFHSVAFDFSVWEMWGALLHGGKLLVPSHACTRDPEAFIDYAQEHGLTVLNQTPSAFYGFTHAAIQKQSRLPSLRMVIFGGEALDMDIVTQWWQHYDATQIQLINMYGITETTVHVTLKYLHPAFDDNASIGQPLADQLIILLDQQQRLVPQGALGEMYVTGAGLAQAYLNDPEKTAQRFLPNPFANLPYERLYRTGDLARFDDKGNLLYAGRIDNQVKIRGFRIELGEIESRLASLDQVHACKVRVYQDAQGGQSIVAYFVLNERGNDEAGDGLNQNVLAQETQIQEAQTQDAHTEARIEAAIQAIRQQMQAQLPSHMVPTYWLPIDAIPMTPNGKVDEKALPKPQPKTAQAYQAPSSVIEQQLCDIWQTQLGLENVGVHDNFFELGGDSIKSIAVVNQIKATVGECRIEELFRHPTVFALATHLAGGSENTQEAQGIFNQQKNSSQQKSSNQQKHSNQQKSLSQQDAPQPFALLTEVEKAQCLSDDIEDAFPLSYLQQGMIFHHMMDEDGETYHDLFSVKVAHAFQEIAFETALNELVNAQEALRSTLLLSGERPLQKVHEKVVLPLTLENLSTLPEAAQEQAMATWKAQELKRDFDYDNPLWCVHVQILGEQGFYFHLSFHHMLLDGWSVANLNTTLFTRYMALCEEANSATEANAKTTATEQAKTTEKVNNSQIQVNPARLSHYIALEQNAVEDGEDNQGLRAQWEASAKDFHTPWWLTRGSGNTLETYIDIAPEEQANLTQLARQLGVQEKSLYLSVHSALLWMLDSQYPVLTSVVTNGRPATQGADTKLGMFLNTLPMNISVQGNSWAKLIQTVESSSVSLLEKRYFPVSEVQKIAQCDLSASVFNYTNFHVYGGLNQALSVSDVCLEEKTNFLFETSVMHSPTGDARVRLKVDDAVFDQALLNRLAGYVSNIIQAMLSAPNDYIELSPLLGEQERQYLLHTVNAKQVHPDTFNNVIEGFQQQAAQFPNKVAVDDGTHVLTYQALDQLSDTIAQSISQKQPLVGEFVGLYMTRSCELIVSILAVIKAGGAYVPLDPAYPEDRLAYMINDADMALILTRDASEQGTAQATVQAATQATTQNTASNNAQEAMPSAVAQHKNRCAVNVDALQREADALTPQTVLDSASRLQEYTPSQAWKATQQPLSNLIYTSGSTGQPKGVQITQVGIAAMARQGAITGIDASHTMLQVAPVSFDASTFEIWTALLNGASLAVYPQEKMELRQLQARIEQSNATCGLFTPVLFNAIVDTQPQCLASLKTLLVGGEALSVEHINQAKQAFPELAIFNAYGPSEATTYVTLQPLKGSEDIQGNVPIGQPVYGAAVYLLDKHNQLVPQGMRGEICIAGNGLALGYLGQDELTDLAFTQVELDGKPVRLYRTGDLARLNDEGAFEFMGREDHQVKIRGFRIELKEIEQALMRHEGITNAVVQVRQGAMGVNRLVAFYVAEQEGELALEQESSEVVSLSAGDLRQHLAQTLPDYMIPSAFMALAVFPTTPSGKVDDKALQALEPSVELGDASPRNETEEKLAHIWAEYLGMPAEGVGVFDNFFELGGDSLLLLRIAKRIDEIFGRHLSIQLLFSAPTIAEIAVLLPSSASNAIVFDQDSELSEEEEEFIL